MVIKGTTNASSLPKVSVVITTYNREVRYVEEALDSALNQTYPCIEVIVVDDNGCESEISKGVAALCARRDNVRYLRNDKNIGAQRSRNAGITACFGEFIAFLDDDDIWVPEKIEKQMALFASADIGMVYCDGWTFNDGDMENTWEFREASLFDVPISHELELFNDYIGSTSQALVRRECFDCVGLFDPDMPARQDYEMWLRISRKYKIVGVPERLLYYRKHPGERISTNWSKCRDSYCLILEKYVNDYKSCSYARAKLLLRLFDYSIRLRDYGNALSFFAKAFVANPVCVLGVIDRRVRRIPFSRYYSLKKLRRALRLNE